MEVPTMTIDREEARKRVQEFTAKRRRNLTEMDRALMRGFQAASEGLALVDVNEAVRTGGVFEETGLPKIALSRPDQKVCFHKFNREYPDGRSAIWGCTFQAFEDTDDAVWKAFRATFSDDSKLSPWDEAARVNLRVEIPGGTMPEPPAAVLRSRKRLWATARTLVPEVPIQYRPNGDAENYLVLWEVKEWQLRAPADPLLLESIAHPVYVVVAQWDLTELEQKLLEAFRG